MATDSSSKVGSHYLPPNTGGSRPFRCIIAQAFFDQPKKLGLNGDAICQVLTRLLESIGQGRYQPFFNRAEINRLMDEEILKVCGKGRYYQDQKLDSLVNWGDLICSPANAVLNNRELLQAFGPGFHPDKAAVLGELKGSLRNLKIIEDWIFYNQDVQNTIRAIVAEQAKKSILLKPEYQKAGRPPQIKTILVVDDDRNFLELVNDFAIREGLKAELVLIDPGRPIREQVEKFTMVINFDLIIMDGKMPDINGADLTRVLRQKGFSGYIFANTDNEDLQAAIMSARADYALTEKIYDLSKLFQK